MGISGPTGDLINLSTHTPRTGSIPTTTTASINPFDAFTGFPESTASSDTRFPYPVSGTDTTFLPDFDVLTTDPSSIYSGVTLDPYTVGHTPSTIIPAPSSATRARMDPPTEDPRAVPDPNDSDQTLLLWSSRQSSSAGDTMPSLVDNDVASLVDYPSLTLSAQIAELDLSDADTRRQPTSVPTTPSRPDPDVLSELISPTMGRHIFRLSVTPVDRVAFDCQHYPSIIPVRAFYTSQSYVRRPRGYNVTRW
jgi:hypothetical protein